MSDRNIAPFPGICNVSVWKEIIFTEKIYLRTVAAGKDLALRHLAPEENLLFLLISQMIYMKI